MKETLGQNTILNQLIDKCEKTTDRYIEAEKFILELAHLKWYQKLFITKRIINFMETRFKKYDF